jgi:hypothetical protein
MRTELVCKLIVSGQEVITAKRRRDVERPETFAERCIRLK